MKAWQFYLVIVLLAAILFIVVKIGKGLQAAQVSVSKITDPITSILSSLGI